VWQLAYPLSVPESDWLTFVNDGVSLAARRFGGSGDGVLFLHGLGGYSGEWSQVATGVQTADLVGLDLRGHGHSERMPSDVSVRAFSADVSRAIRTLGRERVHLVGQSFGAHIAFLVAAWNPELVSSLVVIEADPDGPNPDAETQLANWLRSWPRPFPTRAAAVEFFAPHGSVWADGLEERDGGLWPRFDHDVLLTTLHGLTARDWWEEWARITCPTLVVRGERGDFPLDLANQMAASLPAATVVTIPDAGHNLHLDQPRALARVLSDRLA
jgi:pimeloyl-ACP methyl ester carboxylesterase